MSLLWFAATLLVSCSTSTTPEAPEPHTPGIPEPVLHVPEPRPLPVPEPQLTLLEGPHAGPSPFSEPETLTVRMTAYNSLEAQTDASPHTTSTGERTRPGIVAVSRDLLGGALPYGTRLEVVSIEHAPRSCRGWVPGYVLEVQDTMHPRKRNQVDLWLASPSEARTWGVCEARVRILSSS